MQSESFRATRYQIDVEFDEQIKKIVLTDTYSNVAFADSAYRYSAFVQYDGKIVELEGLFDPNFVERPWRRGGKIVSIVGFLGGPDAKPRIKVAHRFYISDDEEYFEERLILQNLNPKPVVLRGYRFAFRKRLEKPKKYGGPGIDIENYRIVALPFRLQPDGKKHDYQLDDIYHGRYQCSTLQNPMRVMQDVVDQGRGRSEAWAWTDGEYGLMMAKYNPEMVEYSMLETEHREDGVYLNFGGAVPSLFNEPFEVRHIEQDEEAVFGKTRYYFYEGLWRRGAYMFRDYMSSMGHGMPDNYNPPINWNAEYGIGWHHNNHQKLAEHYTLDALEKEAKYAKEIGCEALYLGPGWEECEGSTKWDEERLGNVNDFVNHIKEEYGLKVGFRTIGRSYCDDYPGMYRRTQDGCTGYFAPYKKKPFYEPCICNEEFQKEKFNRISKMADAGMDFILFDQFDWRGACFDPSHGHPIPTTTSMHASAVVDLISKVREKYPHILLEAHDPIWPWGVRYLPVYYQHGKTDSFDEIWGFQFTWTPLEDLLSGKALSLFYYNLGYEVPLYLHINMDDDNENCLAFWWYASTIRHLGIGGGQIGEKRYNLYKMAMQKYKSLRDLYTHGKFYAIDEMIHIHVLPEEDKGVMNAFNLTDTPVLKKIELKLHDLELMENLQVIGAPYEIEKGKLILTLEIPPFSPLIIKLSAEKKK